MAKRILFLTGTRADFGKLKPLIQKAEADPAFDVHVFITGMHMLPQYGSTWDEVRKCGFKKIHTFINQRQSDSMDTILANTIHGLGSYLQFEQPDLVVVHGDRLEALAGAIVGALNNILVAHVEGGEVSGTIDESIRHSVSKLAHIHLVANEEAMRRLLQMGEDARSIHVIGSPDLDLMLSEGLPSLEQVRDHYAIGFDRYAILAYHPVTSELGNLRCDFNEVVDAVSSSGTSCVAIYPNNDPGSEVILDALRQLEKREQWRLFPSLRFEAFLVLLKHCSFMIGNSSAGVREAPFYSVPSINVGTRQHRRATHPTIINVAADRKEIAEAIQSVATVPRVPSGKFGDGNSADRFVKLLRTKTFWETGIQKCFLDMD